VNEALKVEAIKEYVAKNALGYHVDAGDFLYATIPPKAWEYALFGQYALFKFKYMLVFFEADRIVFEFLNMANQFTGNRVAIPRTDIKAISYKDGMLQGTLKIVSTGGSFALKVSKAIASAKYQKPNLIALRAKNFEG
jgi:hypothetical protein